MSPSPKSDKRPELTHVQQVVFLGEQDGPPERELKARLTQLFDQRRDVLRAYLSRVSYGDSANTVALCVRADPEVTNQVVANQLVEMIGKVFGDMFGEHEHLDIIFLSDTQESNLTKSCSAFFQSLAS
jgi:CRISPR/Cas system-associated endoribonuclease Cas2